MSFIQYLVKCVKYGRANPEIVNFVVETSIEEGFKKQLLVHPKQEYYDNKYPKKKIVYIRHETDGIYWIDVKNYFQPYDQNLPKIEGKTDDEIAYNSLIWTIDNIDYISDSKQYEERDYFAYHYQTLKHKAGDCDDHAILIGNLLLGNGIPYWKIRICAGTVYRPNGERLGGHAYTLYYLESKDRWIAIDSTFYKSRKPLSERPDYKEQKIYNNGNVWWSFNQKYSYHSHSPVRREEKEIGRAKFIIEE